VLEINLHYAEFLQNILAKDTVNFPPESVGNIWKIIHGEEAMIRPDTLANLERGFHFDGGTNPARSLRRSRPRLES